MDLPADAFDGVWDTLQPREQARVIELLIESVVWDGEAESVSITFQPTGIKTLAAREEAHERVDGNEEGAFSAGVAESEGDAGRGIGASSVGPCAPRFTAHGVGHSLGSVDP
jgi:hypothetical protein